MTAIIERNSAFITTDDLQAKLNAMPGSYHNSYHEVVWFFEFDSKPKITISFVELYEFIGRNLEWYKRVNVDLLDLTKRAWLDSASLFNSDKWRQRFSGILLFWTALAERNITSVTVENLPNILEFLLTHSWRGSKHFRLNGLQSSVNYTSMVSIHKWRRAFNSCGQEIIHSCITEARINKVMSKLVPKISNDSLTFSDWKTGGSYNHLTLDFGQYYVEHCMEFFYKHAALAATLNSTFNKIPDLSKQFECCEALMSKFVLKFLEGKSLPEIQREMTKNRSIARADRSKLFQTCAEHFETSYRTEGFKRFMLETSSLRSLLELMKMESSYPNLDRIKAIVWQWLKSGKTHHSLDLMNKFAPTIDWAQFEAAIETMKSAYNDQEFLVPNLSYYESLGLDVPTCPTDAWRRYPRQLIKKVEQAGLTLVVALTGWRRTEYGFPLESISQTQNFDVLDQYSFPARYRINWYVSKTHGEEKIEREITFDIAVLIESLASIIAAKDGRPCLYRSDRQANPSDSGQVVKSSVVGLWKHFVENYSGFKHISDLTIWQELASTEGDLSEHQIAEKSRLLHIRSDEEWNNMPFDVNLFECWHRARSELPILNFVFHNTGSDKKNNWLSQYRKGTLPSAWIELIDQRLSSETRDWIKGLSDAEANIGATSREVTHLLTAECLYPTPHAFRHMFAEAIYRRYDGDIGWMIRSCFKHISRVMWQTYIRDKFNRASLDVAKVRIINSIILNYLKKKGDGYAGPMQKWLRRLLRNSSVMTTEELAEFADHLSTHEILDVKANPWGYCMLKKRTKAKAHCASLGEPQRHEASPALCLNCTHNLIQPGNVEWILFHLQTHVATLQNKLVPDFFKKASYSLIKNATQQIRNMAPNHEALEELQSSLNSYAGV